MSTVKMKITQAVELQPFTTPNFILFAAPPGLRGEGFKETPKIALADAEPETLSILCDRFRRDIFEKAGKKDPQR